MVSARNREEVEHALGVRIIDAAAIGGGCISAAYRLECANDRVLFMKTAPANAPRGLMEQEAASLKQLEQTRTVRVPAVLGVTAEWLALEWLEPSAATAAGWETLGHRLARLHRNSAAHYGRDETTCIGTLRQTNEWTSDWPSFWRTQRLQPQLLLAADMLSSAMLAKFEQLLDELDDRLGAAVADGPSLLHGDLWSGNVHFTKADAALIDPSSYYGHREVDLAMAALFGGFPASFLAAYSTEWPLAAGAESRRPVYQLYYLLVHVNLFGTGYIRQTRQVLESVWA